MAPSQNAVLIHDGQPPWEGNQAVIRMFNGEKGLARLGQFVELACGTCQRNKRSLAFLIAMSILPTQASSIRTKAFRLAPKSTTAMHILCFEADSFLARGLVGLLEHVPN